MEKANIEQIKEITKTALKTQDILQKLNSSAAKQE